MRRAPSRTAPILEEDEDAIRMLSHGHESEISSHHGPVASHSFSRARQVALVCILAGASFLNTIAVQSNVIILPQIGRALNVPEARQQWIISAYNLTFACFLLLWSRLADVYGRRNIFLLGSAWVAICSLVSPFMPDEISFDFFRGLQGVGAAANVPTAIGILGSTFPPGKAKTYAISLYSAGFPLGSVIGNILGGILGQYAGWQWVFWVMAIIAFIITVAGYFAIPTPKTSASTSNPQSLSRLVDWIGGALITLAILALLAALTEGNIVGWSTPYIPVLIVISAVLTAMFIYWQYHQERGGLLRTIFCFRALRKHQLPHTSFANPSIPAMPRRPLIKPSIFRNNPRLALAQLIQALSFGAFNNFLIFATFIYQNHQHLDPIQTTLRFIPTGVSGLLTVLFTSYVLSRIPVFFILTPGCAGIATSCLLFAAPIPDGTTYWAYGFPAMCLSVLGVDTVYPCLTLYTIQNLDEEDQAMGGGIVNVLGQMGRALGLAIATAVQVAVERDRLAKGNGGSLVPERESASAAAQLAGYRAANYTGFAFAIAAVFIAIASFWGAGVVGKK